MTPVLKVEALNVEIPLADGLLKPVREVSFHVDRSEVLGIVGESGCGKSLTSLALMGLLPRNARRRAGAIRLAGQDISQWSDRRMANLRGNRMAMIFQEPMTSLNPLLTIGDQLTEVFIRHGRGTGRAARARAIELLAKVGIAAAELRLAQYPHQLSGGMRQRVMIAMALMCEPELIIADEPTTALDVTVQAQVLRLLKRLQEDLGLAVIFITHDLGIVARLADRVLVMYGGEIVEQAPVAEIFARPSHPYTQGLLSCLPAPGKSERLGTIPGTVPSLFGDVIGCTFADRCRHATASCRLGPIAPRQAGGGHEYRCILPAAPARDSARVAIA